jgi:hypothetical protein
MLIEELDHLIFDAREYACHLVLKEVVNHLERRGFLFPEIVLGMGILARERGFDRATYFIEKAASIIKDPLQKQENDDCDII